MVIETANRKIVQNGIIGDSTGVTETNARPGYQIEFLLSKTGYGTFDFKILIACTYTLFAACTYYFKMVSLSPVLYNGSTIMLGVLKGRADEEIKHFNDALHIDTYNQEFEFAGIFKADFGGQHLSALLQEAVSSFLHA